MVKLIESPRPLLPEILSLHGNWKAGKEALICGNARLSWAELIARSNKAANGLVSLGLERGDRVVVLMSNSVAMVEVLLGAMIAGCASAPLNLSVSDESVDSMIEDAGPRAVVTTRDQLARLSGREKPGIRYLSTGAVAAGWTSYDELTAGQPAEAPDVTIESEDLLNIIYSSGTTALPKGIAHTQRGRRDWAYDLALALRYHSGARTLVTIGLYSNISWVAMLTTLLAGGTLVIHENFDVDRFWQTLLEERISHIAMVPAQYQRILEFPGVESADTSGLQSVMSCGSPMHEELRKRLFEVFGCGMIELYGLTEGIITTLDPEEAEGRWRSVGKPLIGTDIAILDHEDRMLGPGENGEVVSRGRIAMPCYFNQPQATEEVIWRDEKGRQWLRSGDIGCLDEEGYLYIVDRKKDMILSGGQNIYPRDIEARLITHPQVMDVAVIAAHSRRWGETPIALVVPESPGDMDTEAVMEWCNRRLGKRQFLADLILVDALPRNPNGKILKRELRRRFADRVYS